MNYYNYYIITCFNLLIIAFAHGFSIQKTITNNEIHHIIFSQALEILKPSLHIYRIKGVICCYSKN